MDAAETPYNFYPPAPGHSPSSSSSVSAPPLPSLETSDRVTRRRSWGKVEEGQDPLVRSFHHAGPAVYTVTDDPFDKPYSTHNMYSTAQAGPSTTSLIEQQDTSSMYSGPDDEARLTGRRWSEAEDNEQATTPRTRRRTIRYSSTPSPLKKTGTAIKSVSANIRRMSLRVVNLAASGMERLDGKDGGMYDDDEDAELPDLSKRLPIRGRTMCLFGPQSRVRLALYRALIYPWTEAVILLLIILNAVVLTIQSSRSLTLADDQERPPRIRGYFHRWEDYVLFTLFVLFTLEAFARICVSGFLFDPEVPASSIFHIFSTRPDASAPNVEGTESSLNRQFSITQKLRRMNSNMMRPFTLSSGNADVDEHPSTVKEKAKHTVQLSQTVTQDIKSGLISRMNPFQQSEKSDYVYLPFRISLEEQHNKTQRNVPYLRHSWSRIDFVAIIGFWVSFALSTTGVERGTHHIGIFRALSVIRTARLLAITSGTTTIMHSLKTARPLLTSVAYFVLFAMILFSIIGIQSFQGSMRRNCYLSPTLGVDEIAITSQFCGGYINAANLTVMSYIQLDGEHALASKGYICPIGQVCREAENPENNIQSFDTIWFAALQVIIVASANGWSPLMYGLMDSEYFVSCLFFIICVIILNFWLINLFVAVITNTFSAIRKETSKSAFGAGETKALTDDQDDGWAGGDVRQGSRQNLAKVIYSYSRWCWVLLALVSLALQASRDTDVSDFHELIMYYGELGITFAFDVEIVLRVLAALPDWRDFFRHPNNVLDLVLAVGCSVIQIPAIQNSDVYPWLTIMQLMRFYRVILVMPRMRPLLLAVFGNMYGLANMTLFLIAVNYLAALVGVQMLRGDYGAGEDVNFANLYNAFLGVYQVFSSENWTDVLYGSVEAEAPLGQTVVVVLFVSAWMLFANFIVMQMFIAVINENFDVAEESKKSKQVTNYYATTHVPESSAGWMRRLNPYRWVRANPVTVKVENLPSNLILPMQKSLVQDYSLPKGMMGVPRPKAVQGARHYANKSLSTLHRLYAGAPQMEDVPLATLKNHARDEQHPEDEETERHLELLASLNNETTTTEDVNDAMYERRAQRADFIRDHPSYDKTFWIFPQDNLLRNACQKLVVPANGERIFGTPQSAVAHTIFQTLLCATVLGGIVVEVIATPLFRRNFYIENGLDRLAWFDYAEVAFGFTLLVEFLIKIVADGFMFTPNAYVRSTWNIMDMMILAGLLVNVSTGLVFVGGFSRTTRSLKALRVLRLITIFDATRKSFQSLIISGASRIFDAAMLAILYMIPYAVWGLNLFSGKMNLCNDGDVAGQSECLNEFTTSVYGDSFGFVVPRVWDNPSPSTTFSFDNFRSSLLILFEIVSLEGWTDVMFVGTAITRPSGQPETNAHPVNALFFVIYNLLGGVIILTLFVSIIIGNFTAKTGTALLTRPQREWIDLKKLITRQRPSKRPKKRPAWTVRAWCFDRAVHKHGWWARLMLVLYVVHIIALMTQTYTSQNVADTLRNDFFLALTFVYILDVVIRLLGLGWRSFRANGWNLFDIVSSTGSLVTTIIVRFQDSGFLTQQLQKLFLVSMAFKLVQRTNSLNKLFKTVMASLNAILNLLILWLIFFGFFAILFVEVFGLTKLGVSETRTQNYNSVANALVMLAFMSTGEGWNAYMHDYAIRYPRCTNSTLVQGYSDCGSVGWAFTLFITWNVLSQYIFVNLFTGVVVDNFSYVFQTSGGAKSITREQMRAFKKVWAEYANPKTGYLERNRFSPFFSRLSGVFEVRIYPVEFSVPNIMKASKASSDSDYSWHGGQNHGIDLQKLSRVLDGIDFAQARKRRAVYSRLHHEASITHNGLGISFTGMLTLLAHHKLIVDHEALVLHDLVSRTRTNKLVTDLVNLDRVRSLLKSISHRRRFLAHMERQRQSRFSAQDIPSIIVDPMPSTPPMSTRDIASLRDGTLSTPGSPTPQSRFYTPDISLASDMSPGKGLQRSSRRISDISMLGTADVTGYKMPRTSISEDDPTGVFSSSSLENSMWGNLMSEAVKEEQSR